MLEVMVLLFLQEEGRFFGRRDVDFWNEKRPPRRTVWAEPVFGPDGRMSVHVPPPEVVEFLESPTRENAARYLAWQRERTDKLRKAMEMLAEVQSPALYYFSRPDCPVCREQEKALAGFRVVRVPPESPLWARYDVRIVPTLVLVSAGGARVFPGFTPRSVLEKEVARVDR